MDFYSNSGSFPTKTHRLSHTDTDFLSVYRSHIVTQIELPFLRDRNDHIHPNKL